MRRSLDALISFPLAADGLHQVISELERCKDRPFLLFPTQRLASRFAMLWAQKNGGSALEPGMATLSWFLQDLSLYRNLPTGANADLQQVLLLSLLEGKPWRYLHRMHAHEILQFFKEIDEHELKQPFARLQNILREDIYRDLGQIDKLGERFLELEALYVSWTQHLKEMSLERSVLLNRQALDLPELDLKAWQSGYFNHLGAEGLWFIGFTTMSPGLLDFCQRLLPLQALKIFVPPLLRLFESSASPVGDMCQILEPGNSLMSYTLADIIQHSEAGAEVRIVSQSSLFAEVEWALRQAETLVAGGLPPHQIAFILPKENPYTLYFHSFHGEYPTLQLNLAVPVSLQQCRLGQAWLKLMGALVGPEQVELMEAQSLKAASLVLDLELEQVMLWRSQLRQIVQPGQRLHEMANALLPLLEKLVKAHQGEIFDRLVLQALQSALLDLPPAETFFGWKDPQAWLEILAANAVRQVGDPLRGAQVMALDESRLLPFEAVFVLGCLEGAFPKAPPEDLLVDDFFKRRLDLPGWEALQAKENTSFQLLLLHARRLILSYPSNLEGKPTVPSRYLEILHHQHGIPWTLGPTETFEPTTNHNQSLTLKKQKEGEAPFRFQLAYQNTPINKNSRISVSGVEALIQCPHLYAWKSLGIQAPEDDEQDAIIQGKALHAAVEHLIKSLNKDGPGNWAKMLTEHLRDHLRTGHAADQSLLLWMEHHGWPKFLEIFSPLLLKNVKGELKISAEQAFQYPWQITEEWQLQVYGKMDQIIEFPNGLRIILDFKRRSMPSASQAIKGLKPQLPLYAGASSDLPVLTVYFSLIKGEWIIATANEEGLKLAQEASPFVSQSRKATQELAMLAATEKVRERLEAWQHPDGIMPDVSHCGLCDFSGICRKAELIEAGLLSASLETEEPAE
jgi:RecB family exonuclease